MKKNSEIELNVCFYGSCTESFKYTGTNYFSIHTRISKMKAIINRKSIKLESDFSKFLDVVNQVKPDIIHLHGSESVFVQLLLEELTIPIVVSI